MNSETRASRLYELFLPVVTSVSVLRLCQQATSSRESILTPKAPNCKCPSSAQGF